MEVVGNWLARKWGTAQGRSATELGVQPRRPVLCRGPEGDRSQGVRLKAPLCLEQETLWAGRQTLSAQLPRRVLTSGHLCAINIQAESKTHLLPGQWVSGGDNRLQISGSDNHLRAICARFGLQTENGYEMLCLFSQLPKSDSFDSYA